VTGQKLQVGKFKVTLGLRGPTSPKLRLLLLLRLGLRRRGIQFRQLFLWDWFPNWSRSRRKMILGVFRRKWWWSRILGR
jgi:hypothetical protein